METPFREYCLSTEEWSTNDAHEALRIRAAPIKEIFRPGWPQASSLLDAISETYSSIELIVPWTAIPVCRAAE
ncbi:hypothetical protein PDE_00316 [Penicillium oxalicum 114-2]|uniref:Uncharacterized protein n=1 Tax=Penicillium oxalicum (strain 114-2 / CGMCC 5302) TaxID=933388 RepID=S8AI53_PENO1|nr:hypothetical protein PDE_00316 [Penicillium oxalicum 114-2]